MAYEFKITRLVEFSETDMAGIVHFTAFFYYMEQAEHAFYRSLGLSVVMENEDQHISWPRVRASCDYRKPLRFEDEVEIHLIVREKKAKAIVYEFAFRKVKGKGQGPGPKDQGAEARAKSASDAAEEVARGELVVVCITKEKGSDTMRSINIPAVIADRIDEAPREMLAKKD